MTTRRAVSFAVSVSVSCALLFSSSAPVRARQQDPPSVAGPFNKIAPANGSTRRPLQVALSWGTSAPLVAGASAPASMSMQSAPGYRRQLKASGETSTLRYGVQEARQLREAAARMPGAPRATFQFTYNMAFPAAAKIPFEAAANVWGGLLNSAVPIKIDAVWEPLGPGVLGSAGPQLIYRNFVGAPRAATWYPSALADKLTGTDLDPTIPEIGASFSSEFAWYLGIDGNPPMGTFDFMTVVMHEIGHGLGFLSSANIADFGGGLVGIRGFGNAPPFDPIIMDHGIESGAGTSMQAIPDESVQLLNFFQSDDVFFDGPNTLAANGGLRARLYAPATGFEPGSSMSHLNDATYDGGPNALMTHALGFQEVGHMPGAVAMGIFADMDWGAAAPPTVNYEVCVDTTNNNLCDVPWTNAGTATSATVINLQPATIYYWQVRATSSGGGGPTEANSATWFNFSTTDPTNPGDFDGNGTSDVGVFRAGTFFINGGPTVGFGQGGDVPVVGDWNGDGTSDIAVFRPQSAHWFFQFDPAVQFGQTGDRPVVGDFNGDGIAEMAVFRTAGTGPAQFLVKDSVTVTHGARGDIPVTGDWDRDGRDDIGVYEPDTGAWRVLQSSTNFVTPIVRSWGATGDLPVNGDFDGDLREDFGVFRTGTWLILRSGNGYTTPDTISFGTTGDVPIGGMDVNNDGSSDLTIFRPSTGQWFGQTRTGTPILLTGGLEAEQSRDPENPYAVSFGAPGDIPLTARPEIPKVHGTDFDGDVRSDITIFRPSTGQWFTKLSASNFVGTAVRQWGVNGDVRVPGDYDGDKRADVAIYRPSAGTWYVQLSSTNFTTFFAQSWGVAGDVPMPDDFDGDGRTDIAIYRPSTGQWFAKLSSTGYATFISATWGVASDIPVTGDYDGDGRSEFGVYRPSTGQWLLRMSGASFGPTVAKTWGIATDVPVPADFDGDGRTDLAVYRASTGQWFIADALFAVTPPAIQWGVASDLPIPHDFDGDRVTDAAIYRPSTGQWFVRRSSNGTQLVVQWGLATDQPLLRIDLTGGEDK